MFGSLHSGERVTVEGHLLPESDEAGSVQVVRVTPAAAAAPRTLLAGGAAEGAVEEPGAEGEAAAEGLAAAVAAARAAAEAAAAAAAAVAAAAGGSRVSLQLPSSAGQLYLTHGIQVGPGGYCRTA